MIETRFGDVLNVPTGIIVHGCNSYGAMGAGIALQIKNRFPTAYDVYRAEVVRRSPALLELGTITYAEVAPFKFIVNAVTQASTGSGRQISYDAIVECFEKVNQFAHEIADRNSGRKLDVFFPAIGAGRGGGDWPIIEMIIDRTVDDDFTKVLYLFDE